jgi:uncharacterized membrane protein
LSAVDTIPLHLLVVGLHLLGATVWTGGHLILATTILPAALRARDPAVLLGVEQRYERVGMPALALQVATGIWLALQRAPHPVDWLTPDTAGERAVAIKLALLAVTVALALNARLRVIPRLDAARLPVMGVHIVAVTLISVAFLVVGLSFRMGGLG